VADAYREYRKVIHSSKLQGKDAKVPTTEIVAQQTAVSSLWSYVLG
jgi:glutamate-ammonia-ligase adenylyltransferase